MTTIGVLAVQGAFREHIDILNRLEVDVFEIRKPSDLSRHMDGLVLPGGESTVIGKLLRDLDMFDTVRNMISDGLPVMGTCAGMILLADRLSNDDRSHLSTMPVTVRRNAYGKQLGSFSCTGRFADMDDVPMRFIRAPYVEECRDGAEVLSMHDSHITSARFGNQLALAFHPELTDDTRVHRYFLSMVDENIRRQST